MDKAKLSPGRAKIVDHSAAFLPACNNLLRKPRFAFRPRPESFFEGFEQHALIYDVFWGENENQVLLIGPPPRNLMGAFKRAKFTADGTNISCAPKFYISQSVMIIELNNVPLGTNHLQMEFEGHEFSLPIQPSYANIWAKKNVLFTLSKNNSLDWITAWADFHARFHGVDAVVFFDNGSDNSLEEIVQALEKSAVKDIVVMRLPYIYGAIDTAVTLNPYWTHFLQISCMSIALRRFAAGANALLNCDIDELIAPTKLGSVFASLKQTPRGLLVMNGAWIEAQKGKKQTGFHQDFIQRKRDEKQRLCTEKKWVLAPQRNWIKSLNIHPYMHWIEGRPRGAKTMDPDVFFWHFKGINNNWKVERNIVDDTAQDALEIDPELRNVFESWTNQFDMSNGSQK